MVDLNTTGAGLAKIDNLYQLCPYSADEKEDLTIPPLYYTYVH